MAILIAIQSLFNIYRLINNYINKLCRIFLRHVQYKTSKHNTNEDIEIEIPACSFIDILFQFIFPFNGLHYLLTHPIKKSKTNRLKFDNLFKLNLFPIWIDSDSNVFISTDEKSSYNKKNDTRFSVWLSRNLYQITGKNLTMNVLRKMCVTSSRNNKWNEDEINSLATSMLHTPETANRVYYKTSTHEKTSIAVNLLNKFN